MEELYLEATGREKVRSQKCKMANKCMVRCSAVINKEIPPHTCLMATIDKETQKITTVGVCKLALFFFCKLYGYSAALRETRQAVLSFLKELVSRRRASLS